MNNTCINIANRYSFRDGWQTVGGGDDEDGLGNHLVGHRWWVRIERERPTLV